MATATSIAPASTREVRDPGRTLPRALLFGMLAVTVCYIVVSAVFLYLIPLEKVMSDQTGGTGLCQFHGASAGG